MEELVTPDMLDVLYNLGDYAIFLWLYVTERRSHEATRQRFEEELEQLVDASISKD